jgi:hypothetical protein
MQMGRLALVTIGAIIFLAQAVNAQSGRRSTPGPTATPVPATSVSPSTSRSSTSASTTSTVDSGENSNRPKFHPKAFIIAGKTKTEGFKSWGGDDVGDVADEIKFMFEFQHFPARIVKGGKMTREQAIARAKQETDSYVLWMEIVERSELVNLRAITTVDHIDYLLIMPGTGEVARKFTLDPGKIVQTNEQGTPLPPRTQGRSRESGVQLRQCGWEIARVLRYWL